MKFTQALKVTDAAAKIARLMATLSIVCRNAATELGILSVQARTFWLLSVTQTTAPHHVASRLTETVRFLDYVAQMDSRLRDLTPIADALSTAGATRDELFVVIDEIKAAVETPASGQRRDRS